MVLKMIKFHLKAFACLLQFIFDYYLMRKIISLMTLMLAGCYALLAKDLRVELAPAWPADSCFSDASTSDDTSWWRTFDDPMLDSLIDIGRANNYNLAAASRRIDIARSQLRSARGAYAPEIGISASYDRTRQSGRMAGREGDATTLSYFNAGATMNWEIDVFGKIRAQTRRAGVNVRVSAAEYAAAMVALDAEIASAYIELQVNKMQLAIAREHSANQAEILRIVKVRHETGLVSELDEAQAKTLYYSTIASIPMLEAQIEASYNALGVLTGLGREGLPTGVYADASLPGHFQLIATGAPVDLLRRRPDVVEAERNIELAAAELGIARSEYLPSLSLSASLGTAAHNFGDLFSRPSFSYSVVPTLSWTLFDGLQRRNNTAAARQTMEAQIDAYNMTVLTAVEEVRNAMSSYTSSLEYIDRLSQVLESTEEEVRLSLDLYKQGLTMFSNVVDAQLNYLTYQNNLVSARGNAITYIINLYKALGGGWNE